MGRSNGIGAVFSNLPMLVTVSSGSETIRLPLPEKFGKAMERAMGASEKMLMERKWKDEGPRYGDLRLVGEVVMRKISAVYEEKIKSWLRGPITLTYMKRLRRTEKNSAN